VEQLVEREPLLLTTDIHAVLAELRRILPAGADPVKVGGRAGGRAVGQACRIGAWSYARRGFVVALVERCKDATVVSLHGSLKIAGVLGKAATAAAAAPFEGQAWQVLSSLGGVLRAGGDPASPPGCRATPVPLGAHIRAPNVWRSGIRWLFLRV
jgi:hypothetical protein